MYTCIHISIYVHIDTYLIIYVYVNIYLIEGQYAHMKTPTTENLESIKDPTKRNETNYLSALILCLKIFE